ncbi:CC/Se motif family (seleno)protein [Vreelandella glaciei]|uniref:CC/Se motif family (seleno)protein n=1 Tax=Vreelandella glaciei TaxID=186761 RepID=UPI003001BCA5
MLEIIDVSDAAKAFIKQQGGVVTVRLSPRHGCCGGLANVAVAEANAPKDPSLYQRHSDEDITLFIATELAYQGLRVDVEGIWKLRHLYVDGSYPRSGHTNKH